MNQTVLIAEYSEVPDIAKALTSQLRRKILRLIAHQKLNINQISQTLGIPKSTCAVNVQILEKAHLIKTEQIPASKGAQKMCSANYQEVVIPLQENTEDMPDRIITTEMPIGLYTDFRVTPTCGFVSSKEVIGYYDHPESFLNPRRPVAQLIWFNSGYLEYRFPKNIPYGKSIESLSFSAEVCSEFPGHNENWPSDITVWINGKEIGTWTSPGDMADRRGRLTPEWWRDSDSQYGFLKTWKVTREASFIDGVRISNITLSDLEIEKSKQFLIRIGVKENAENQGGVNLFGKVFGNYNQDIILRLELAE